MKFKNIRKVIEYLNTCEIDEDIIICFSRIENGKMKAIEHYLCEYVDVIKCFTLYLPYKGEIYLYGYTKLSEVIIVHQTIECEVTV